MIDRDRLAAFMRTFYGYGSWSAPLWFIGMKEGGGKDLDEIARRLDAWDGSELVDLRAFHERIGQNEWFAGHPKIQDTWGKLTRVALCSEGRKADTDAVRRCQRDELGRSGGQTALLEMFPLPSPSTKHWIYEDCAIPEISTRETYYQSLRAQRIAAIRQRIDAFAPRAVVFYGLSYRDYWEVIVGVRFAPIGEGKHEVARRGATRFVMAPHPVAYGVRNEEFSSIGQEIARPALTPACVVSRSRTK